MPSKPLRLPTRTPGIPYSVFLQSARPQDYFSHVQLCRAYLESTTRALQENVPLRPPTAYSRTVAPALPLTQSPAALGQALAPESHCLLQKEVLEVEFELSSGTFAEHRALVGREKFRTRIRYALSRAVRKELSFSILTLSSIFVGTITSISPFTLRRSVGLEWVVWQSACGVDKCRGSVWNQDFPFVDAGIELGTFGWGMTRVCFILSYKVLTFTVLFPALLQIIHQTADEVASAASTREERFKSLPARTSRSDDAYTAEEHVATPSYDLSKNDDSESDEPSDLGVAHRQRSV
ncbi:hypothetical protein CPB84DRAFT_1848888 [Gymnopilus junonius]|uniref:Uncharacterized protein n=1 Tax=Gymnopilus junonius TaxID=109634 RepID=A0A9P5TLK9_GYMJU|nr:hypothetical protein CPB84DRAFT_1848888 [Gymnopilus junonius]